MVSASVWSGLGAPSNDSHSDLNIFSVWSGGRTVFQACNYMDATVVSVSVWSGLGDHSNDSHSDLNIFETENGLGPSKMKF